MQELTSDGKSGRYPKSRVFGYLLWWCWVGSKLLGNDVVFLDFLGTCFGGAGLGLNFGYPLWGRGFSTTGFMQEMTSDGKPGRYPKSRLFGHLLWW